MYNFAMIKSFANKDTQMIFNETFSKKFPPDIQNIALRKLLLIDAASCLQDLRILPANHLEKLSGDKLRQYSIRINDKWRICFRLENQNDFYDVQIINYH